jgi:putative transposase
VTSPGEYRWSSYPANALGESDELLTPHPVWLALGNNPTGRCQAYRQLFNTEPPESKFEAIRYSNRKGLPLGTERFKARIESQLQIKLGSGKVGRPAKIE